MLLDLIIILEEFAGNIQEARIADNWGMHLWKSSIVVFMQMLNTLEQDILVFSNLDREASSIGQEDLIPPLLDWQRTFISDYISESHLQLALQVSSTECSIFEVLATMHNILLPISLCQALH
jgi:chaperone required for assembly of F1-ATPase